MLKVVAGLIIIWGVVIASLIFMATLSDDMNEIVTIGVGEMQAVSDLDNYPGIQKSWESFPVWKWFLPPIIGLLLTGYLLYKNRDELPGRSG